MTATDSTNCFEMSNHRLVKAESLTYLKSLEDNSIDALVTDPPYCSGGLRTTARTLPKTTAKYLKNNGRFPEFLGDNKDQRAFYLWCCDWLREAYRILSNPGRILVFTDWRQYPTLSDALQTSGFTWQSVVVWDKTQGCRPVPGRFRSQAEFILVGGKQAIPTEGKVLPGVFKVAPLKGGKFHATGKPVELMKSLIEYVPEGDTILDPFMGSGTTGMACYRRNPFIGIEMSPDYFDIAKQRYIDAFSH